MSKARPGGRDSHAMSLWRHLSPLTRIERTSPQLFRRRIWRTGTMGNTNEKTAVASVLAGVIGLASYGVVRETETIGEGKIVMATGSSLYFDSAESYRRDLERKWHPNSKSSA